jgi:hypothetical protein
MKITEGQLRKTIRQIINERASDDYDWKNPEDEMGGHVMAPSAVSADVESGGSASSKAALVRDAWQAAGGVWRFSEALRFYKSLNPGRAAGSSVNMTLSQLLQRWGRRVTDNNGNMAWALRGFAPPGLKSRPINRRSRGGNW